MSGQFAVIINTMGFLTDFPGYLGSNLSDVYAPAPFLLTFDSLGDSIASSLREIENADIVLHVRDISHPQTANQKQELLSVLKDLHFDQSFYTDRMVQERRREALKDD